VSRASPRIGLIGAGSIAAYHIGGLRAASAVVQAIAAGSAHSASAAAARFGIPHAYGDWRSLVSRGDIDAVIIATPDDTHEEIGLAAVAAGLPAMIQKPLATTSAAALRLVAAARKAGVPLWVSYMHRHFPETRAWRALAAAPPSGDVLSVRLRNATPGPDWGEWFFEASRTGGVVMQLGVHGIDLIEHLLGAIVDVSAMTALRVRERKLADGRLVRPTAPDHAFATYRLESGALVSHEMCFCEPGGTDRYAMTITGATAQAELRGAHGPLAVNAGKGWSALPVPAEDAAFAQHRDWLAMLGGAAPHDASDIAGLQGVLVAEAIAEAAATGRRILVRRADDLLKEDAG
jgi:UDP-N-acetyl-2-amino-2-deoxyglucuronate dehydrogenase